MALKFEFKSKDEIPANDLSRYVERDGAWHLDVEDDPEKSKHAEQRAAAIAVQKELDEFKKRFEGIDPEEVRKVAEEKRQLEEAKALASGQFDKVLKARLESQKAEHDKQLAGMATELDASKAQLVVTQIDQGVTAAATKRGLRPTAIADITARARGAFRLVKGAPTVFDADGQTVRAGKDGVTPMTLDEWVDGQVSEAPHLFESSAGGGAVGSGGGAGARPQGAGKNPWKKETWNRTEQAPIRKRDPGLAARLEAAAA